MRSTIFKQILDFIKQLYGNVNTIPLHKPVFSGKEKDLLAGCIDSIYVSSVGPFITDFESLDRDFTMAGDAVAVINGPAALHLSLLINDVQPGDLVITQALTFIAATNAIRYTGADPVFRDFEKDTLGMSPNTLEDFLSNHSVRVRKDRLFERRTGRRIGACLPVHVFGHPARIDRICKLCSTNNIPVIEDAAESIGGIYLDRHTGTFGDAGILIFNGNKTITTGGGGMILLKDEGLAQKARHLSTQAKIDHK